MHSIGLLSGARAASYIASCLPLIPWCLYLSALASPGSRQTWSEGVTVWAPRLLDLHQPFDDELVSIICAPAGPAYFKLPINM